MNRPSTDPAPEPLDTIAAVSSAPGLFADSAPRRSHALRVGGGHVLHVDESGAPEGFPAIVLHGGPGSGCSPLLRRFFDPQRYRIICMDQRGAGRSEPCGGIEHNTTADLLDDLRAVRDALGIGRWLVVGGSWGATLALAHALDDPGAVAGLLLRATFLARPGDIERFFASAAQRLGSPRGEPLLAWLSAVFSSGDAQRRRDIALAWWRHEHTMNGAPAASAPEGEALDALVCRYRVQSHYLAHGCWLQSPPLLERCTALPRVPTLLLHGSEDRVCPPEGAAALAAAVPHAELRLIAGAGHDPTHPAMVEAMVAALDSFARHGDFNSASGGSPA